MAIDPAVDRDRIRHQKFNLWMGSIAAVAGIASLAIGVYFQSSASPTNFQKSLGQGIVGAWAILPPIFFWYDWCYLSYGDKDDREFQKETHNLARNIWLALIVVLGVMFDIKLQ
ncbi:hypothetical protein TA3x_004185 [Tundrisphaera sp. TA3]|uniref:hypothetical protein n=1 Tax=Tundrisphaera sp. TA3 TaxID=3435775 RepID=UPI003EB79581